MGQSQSTFKVGAQWEWQSNPKPWSSEEKQWTPYKEHDNYLLEKAYFNKKNKVDLGDYIISIKGMLQKKKNNAFKQRKVRRNEESFKKMEELKKNEDETLRKERFIGAETPKTYNKTFGCLEDFLSFFANRGPEIKSFATKFHEIEDSQDLDRLNQEVLPLLIGSIKKESANKKEKQGEEKQLINLFQASFKSFKQFYGNILKAYTLNGFLYKNLNRYLRNEDWTQIDDLLPYAFCLFKAFLWSEITSAALNDHQKPQDDDSQNSKLTVYRGAQLDEILLSFYEPQTVSTFSWNAVTSTSTNRKMAESFMKGNKDSKKIPVMFVIEVPISPDNLQNRNWIDIKPFSVYPTEDEIVLSPGSTFKLTNFYRDNKGAEIQLRLVTEVSILAHQGQIMHGAMHVGLTNHSVSKIVGLEGNELREAISHIKSNGLIEELELTLCKFDAGALATLREILPTIPKLTKLVFVSISSEDKTHWNVIFQALRKQKIVTIQIYDQLLIEEKYMILFAQGLKHMKSLTSLNLNFQNCSEIITDQGLNDLCSQGIKYLTSLTSLNLSFHECLQITDQGLNDLCSQGIKHLTSLTTLNLNFAGCYEITDQGLNNLCTQGINYLTSLTAMNLDFLGCSRITDQGLNDLCSQGIKHLTLLTTLHLSFGYCGEITDQGLNDLGSQAIKYLTSLTTLHLSFGLCSEITDQGLNDLCSQGIKHLTLLTTLDLNFYGCKQITDQGLDDLCSQGIRYLTSLTTLRLSFHECIQITDQGLTDLCSQGIKYLTSLTTLSLDFGWCSEITDQGFNDLCSQGIRYLTSLTTLNLNFEGCSQITDHGFNALKDQANIIEVTLVLNEQDPIEPYQKTKCKLKREIKNEPLNDILNLEIELSNLAGVVTLYSLGELEQFYSESHNYITCLNLECSSFPEDNELMAFRSKYLTSLTTLNLDFGFCLQSTDQELNALCSQGIKYLTSLTTLHLSFGMCSDITDQGLNDLCCQGIKYLTLLTTLHLDFAGCPEITDQGLNNLCYQGIKHLTSLTTLNLNFHGCDEITDQGLNDLCSHGIKHLTSLTTLNLDFGRCFQITDQGLNDLCSQGIRYLTSLTTLNLSFHGCDEITDQGLNDLCSQGIKHLTSLTTLSLNFNKCSKITDQGLTDLCSQGIKYLTSLTSLKLDFEECSEITDQGLNDLCSQGIRYLTSLTTLNLNFADCPNISITGFRDLITLLKYFGYLPKPFSDIFDLKD